MLGLPACPVDRAGSMSVTHVPCLTVTFCGLPEAGSAGGSRAGRGRDRQLCNDYLGYLADRGYSPASVRAYAFDLLDFARWLAGEGLGPGRGEHRCAAALPGRLPGRAPRGPARQRDLHASGRAAGFAPATINRRLAAISGLFSFRSMRDPAAPSPVPRGPAARRAAAGERSRAAGSPGPAEAAVGAAGPRAAAAAPRAGPRRDRRAAGQLPHRPGPGDRRADAAVRAAVGRGARPGRSPTWTSAAAGCG